MINRTEKEIMEHWTPGEIPIVSISAIAYNHGKYIEDALDGLLMQETDFPFEVIVHDDASTDNTAEIIRRYAEKFPNIIRPILQTENQYSKNPRNISRFIRAKSQGKYLALCECDDYWTDVNKLQSQIDILEQNDDISLVFQNAMVHEYNTDGEIIDSRKHTDGLATGYVTIAQVLEKKIIPSASVVYKKVNLEEFLEASFPVGDTPAFMYLGKFGKLYYVDEVTSVYRLLPTGAVKSQLSTIGKNLEFIPYYKTLKKEFSEFELDESIDKLIARRYKIIIRLSIQQKQFISTVKYSVIMLFLYPKAFISMIKNKLQTKQESNDI